MNNTQRAGARRGFNPYSATTRLEITGDGPDDILTPVRIGNAEQRGTPVRVTASMTPQQIERALSASCLELV